MGLIVKGPPSPRGPPTWFELGRERPATRVDQGTIHQLRFVLWLTVTGEESCCFLFSNYISPPEN